VAKTLDPNRFADDTRDMLGEPPAGRFDDDDALDEQRGLRPVKLVEGNKVEIVPPLKWIDANEAAKPLPAPKWVCHDLYVCPGRPCMLAGYGYSGKTIMSQSAVLQAAAGEPIWGQFRAGPIKACHLDHEQGRYATLRRYQRLAHGLELDLEDLQGNFRVACLPRVYLTTQGVFDIYCKALEGWDLCILDSVRAATPGIDENDSAIRRYIDLLTEVSEKIEIAFWLIHHFGKPKEGGKNEQKYRLRGNSAIFDACGTVFALAAGEVGEPIEVKNIKSAAEAEGGAIDTFYTRIEDVPYRGNSSGGLIVRYLPAKQVEPTDTPENRFAQAKQVVLDYIRKHPGCGGRNEIAEHTGLGRPRVSQSLKELESSGFIENRGGSAQTPRLYVMERPGEDV